MKTVFENNIFSFLLVVLSLYFVPIISYFYLATKLFIVNKRRNRLFLVTLLILGLILFVSSTLKLEIFNIYLEKLENFNTKDFSLKIIKLSLFFFLINEVIIFIKEKILLSINSLITKEEERSERIRKENDLIIRQKTEDAKNTTVVVCKSCGASNIVKNGVGTCSYCRKAIYKNINEN